MLLLWQSTSFVCRKFCCSVTEVGRFARLCTMAIFRAPIGIHSKPRRFQWSFNENALEYISIIISVPSEHFVPKCFGVFRRRFVRRLNAGHHIGVSLGNYVVCSTRLEKLADGLPATGICDLLFHLTCLDLSTIRASIAGAAWRFEKMEQLKGRAYVYTIRVTLRFKLEKKTESRNGVEWIEHRWLHLSRYTLGQFSDVLINVFPIMRRRISEVVRPVGPRFPEAVSDRLDYQRISIEVTLDFSIAVNQRINVCSGVSCFTMTEMWHMPRLLFILGVCSWAGIVPSFGT